MSQSIVAVLALHKEGKRLDVELPLDMTANELIVGLNEGFRLGMDTTELSQCHLKAENPIALLRGNKTLEAYGLRNGSVLHITE